MLTEVFDRLSKNIASEYSNYIEKYIDCGVKEINEKYYLYTSLDKFYPRPILTYLGINYQENILENISNKDFCNIIYISQMLRDFLAIHDDVIDEDLIKFSTDTLPYAITKIIEGEENTLNMSKGGKDRAILFADYMLPVIYDIICNVNDGTNDTKVNIIKALNRVSKKTNIGQLIELNLEQRNIADISEDEIIKLYDCKAADYCYAFPLEIGLIFANASEDIIIEMRKVLLRIGVCSQIVNDIEGIFHENYDDERDTLSDLLELRRTYLLVKLAKLNKEKNIEEILLKKKITTEEALIVKEAMINCKILNYVYDDISSMCNKIKNEINGLPVGDVLKEYIKDLIDIRVLSNVTKLVSNS